MNSVGLEKLHIVHYPDPALRAKCAPVKVFGPELEALARRMLELMRADRGIGLAAPQVGLLMRMFVMNVTDRPELDQVFVNPVIQDRQGNEEGEEGCLSLPGIHVQVRRAKRCRIEAVDVHGQPVTLEGEDLIARVWQHETDHLDGTLIIDRMGPADQIATRKALKGLEQSYTGAAR